MRRRVVLTAGLLAAALMGAALFIFPALTRSQPTAGNISLVRVTIHSTPSAVGIIDNSRHAIRPDGSQWMTRIRSSKSTSSPSGWEAAEATTLYSAPENVTYNIYPALRLYGSLPVGDHAHRPLVRISDCAPLIFGAREAVSKVSTGTRFGRLVEHHTAQMTASNLPRKYLREVEVFPELGCLLGDTTLEVRRIPDNELVALKTEQVVSLDVVPDDPALFSGPPGTFRRALPSEILITDAQSKGRDCPDCAIKAGEAADRRHDELWRQRRSGASQ